jgi:hypothetical protein
MKPLSWDKQLGLASPLKSAAGQSNETKNPSKDKDEVVDEMGLDASHHTRIFLRGVENLFFLDISFHRMSVMRYFNSCVRRTIEPPNLRNRTVAG